MDSSTQIFISEDEEGVAVNNHNHNNKKKKKDRNSSANLGIESKFEKALKLEEETKHRLPTEELSQKELDGLYAKDMYELTLKERDQVLQDVHGVADIMEEPDDFVKQMRLDLLEALDRVVANRKITTTAYEQALQQDAAYVKSAKFQLPFLRAVRWDVKLASARIMPFFEAKLELFGPKLLTRKVKISDLSKEDKKSLESGFFQLLPVRDVAGRAIMCGMPMLRHYKKLDNIVRAFYYMVMTAHEDEDTQKAGIILVGYNIGPKRVVDRAAVWSIQRLRKVLPMRVAGMHFCYDDFKVRPMMTIAMLVMGATGRVRFRGHYGTSKDVMYKLLTFGIPDTALPITSDGEAKAKSHRQWLKSRRQQEEEEGDETVIVVPARFDVLLGRGKPIQEHFGNLRYHALLDYYQDAYERAKKFDKMQIAQRIIYIVHEYKGRYLKQEGAGWVVVDDIVARDKVSHAFRTRRTSISNASKQPINTATPTISKRKSAEDEPAVPTLVASAEATAVTDTENEEETSDELMASPIGEKRAKIWAAEFHPV